MSWHFSQAVEAAYLAGHCLDGERFAPWKSMPSALDDSCSGKMKDTCHRSPFGMMFVPSTDTLGGELLTWFLGASPARTFPQPEPVKDLTAHGLGCGWRWPESSVKYDQPSALWKTRQCSLFGGLVVFSETWPRWGTMRNGECWERLTWERHTCGNESGLLPTPLASIGTHGGPNQRDSSGRPGLQMAAESWPTPTVCGNYNRKGASKNSGDGLATAVAKWPTPTKSGGGGGPGCSGRAGGLNLRTAVTVYPTPLASNTKANHLRGADKGKPREARSYGETGQLNPTWVEWLMGWPLGWTDFKPLEMDRCQDAMQRHG